MKRLALTLLLLLMSLPTLAYEGVYYRLHGSTQFHNHSPGACQAYLVSSYSSLANSSQVQSKLQQCNDEYNPQDKFCWVIKEVESDCTTAPSYPGRVNAAVVYGGTQECPDDNEFLHEQGPSECGFCRPGFKLAPGQTPICQLEQEPPECLENGEYYEKGGYCVPECASGSSLDHYCNNFPDPECSSDSADYEGTIGWGNDQRPVCSGETSCDEGERYAFKENAEGSWSGYCINNEANPPVCPNGFEGALVFTDGGFACEGLNPEEGGEDTPDGDSDGDGEADTNGLAQQISQIIKNQVKGINSTDTINTTLKGINDTIKDGTASITEAIGNIPGGGGGNSGGDGGDGGDGEGEEPDPVTWSGEPIDTELTDPEDDYNQVMNDYQAKINEIKADVQAMFSTNLTGGGSVDDNTKTIMGVDVNFSLNRFLPGLDILGAIVLFCAAFISAGILFTSRG